MPKLLLRADGVLHESWHPLDDGPAPEYIPPQWTPEHVSLRFGDGIATLIRMPLGGWGPAPMRNLWPAYQREFDELVAIVGRDGLDDTWKRRNYVRTWPSGKEISRMEQTIAWPGEFVHDDDLTRALNIVILARVRNRDLDDLICHGKRTGVRPADEWRRLHWRACDRIADGLQAERTEVF